MRAGSHADLPVCCSFRHGLRRATFRREEGFGFLRSPTCLSLWERCRAATERAGSLFEGAGLPPCGKTEGVLQIGKIRMKFDLIRTLSYPKDPPVFPPEGLFLCFCYPITFQNTRNAYSPFCCSMYRPSQSRIWQRCEPLRRLPEWNMHPLPASNTNRSAVRRTWCTYNFLPS